MHRGCRKVINCDEENIRVRRSVGKGSDTESANDKTYAQKGIHDFNIPFRNSAAV
jgi:hypothetical protein